MNNKYYNYTRLFIIVSLLILTLTNDAKSVIWQSRNAPTGGYTGELIYTDGGLFSNAYGSGIYLSTDDGDSWILVSENIPDLKLATSLDFDDSYIYAGTLFGTIYRSSINSISWQMIHNGISESGNQLIINKLSVQPSGVYACTNKGLFRTTDYGNSWLELPATGINQDIADVVEYNNRLYIINGGGTVVMNINGSDWSDVRIGTLLIYKIFKMNDLLYFCVNDFSGTSGFNFRIYEKYKINDSIAPYKSNLFENFQVINVSSAKSGNAIGLLKTNNDKFLYNIYYTSDYGINWNLKYDKEFSFAEYLSRGLAITSSNLFVGTQNNGVLKINIQSGNSILNSKNIYNTLCESLLTVNNSFLYGTSHSGIFNSTDYGLTWDLLENSPRKNAEQFAGIIKLINHNNSILAATDRGIYSSSDNGDNWNAITSEIYITGIIAEGNTIYAVGNINSGQFMYSSDNGKTWATSRLPNESIALGLLKDGNVVYANTSNGIFRSSNNGDSWNSVLVLKPETLYITPMIKSGNNLIASSLGDLYLSSDNGFSWAKTVNTPNTVLIRDLKSIDNLLIGATSRGIIISLDNGKNWSQANDGLPPAASISTLSTNLDSVYASVSGNVIFRASAGDFSKIRITDIPGEVFCTGSTFDIAYTVDKKINFAPNNTFIAELSDNTGSFNNEITVIGSVSRTSDGKITVTIPQNVVFGSGYRIRIVSTYPEVTGIDNLKNLTILEKKTPVISGNNTVCTGKLYSYSIPVNPGFNIIWQAVNGEIVSGLSDPTVVVKWNSAGNGILKIKLLSIADCSDSAAFNVAINPTPDKPKITKSANTLISSSGFGNRWYLNGDIIPNDTLQNLSAQTEGIYTLAVENNFGCISEFSDPFYYVKDENLFLFEIDSTSAYSGDDVYVNIRLIKNKKFYESNVRKVTATLVFNASLLYPSGADKGIVINGSRYLQIDIDTNYISQNIVAVVKLSAMLGNAAMTDLTLTNLQINNIPENSFKVELGKFSLLGICYDGGARLVTSDAVSAIYNVSPNPATETIKVDLIKSESSYSELYILNSIGVRVLNLYSGLIPEGNFSNKYSIRALPIGDYSIVLTCKSSSSVSKFIITR